MIFQETNQFHQFFNILPEDWQEIILPVWETYKNSTQCYLLLENEKPVAGGLVFSICPPDMLYAREEAETWLSNGYLYLGFIYVLEERRGQNLGSLWLSKLKDMFPQQKYWLTIEDLELHSFYIKNGFKKTKELKNQDQKEVLYALEH